MPFCTQCGLAIGERDQFCGSCGARQTASATPPPPPPPSGSSRGSGQSFPDSALGSLNPRTASLLCYIPVIGWVPSLLVLASGQFRHNASVRFHAFQGLYLAVAYLVVDWVIQPLARAGGFPFGGVSALKLVVIGACLWMIVKLAQGETFKLPLIGDLAEKSVSEQR